MKLQHKHKLVLSAVTALVGIVTLLLFAGSVTPTVDSAVPVLLMILLIYVISAALIYLVILLVSKKSSVSHLTMTLLIACIPPAIVMVASLRQATFFDIALILLTLILISWYATYKK